MQKHKCHNAVLGFEHRGAWYPGETAIIVLVPTIVEPLTALDQLKSVRVACIVSASTYIITIIKLYYVYHNVVILQFYYTMQQHLQYKNRAYTQR